MFSTRYLSTFFATMLVTISVAAAQENVSLLGTWKSVGDLPDGGTSESTITITRDGDAFKGVVISDSGTERSVDRIKTDGKKVTFEVTIESDGEKGLVRVKAEESARGRLAGKWYLIDSSGEERASAPWIAERISEPEVPGPEVSIVGKWNAKAVTNDGNEMLSTVTFATAGDKLTGKSVSERGETAFDSVGFDGKQVEVEMTLEFNDNALDVRIEAALKDADHLEGKWVIFNDSGEEAATGAWSAERMLELDLVGTWSAIATTDDGDNKHQAIFEKDKAGYKGRAEGDFGTAEYTLVEVSGNDLRLGIPFGEGSVKIAARYQEKDKLTGKWTFFDSSGSEQASNDWVATRQAAAEPAPSVVGDWEITVTIADNSREYALNIEKEDDGLQGFMVSPRSGKYALDSVTFDDGLLVLKVTRDIEGNEIEFIYKGKLADDGTLSGSFVPKGYEDQFSGEWTGKRKSS